MDEYKKIFDNLIKIGKNDLWTTDVDEKLIVSLWDNEIDSKREIYNKSIKWIAMCLNKYDVLGYFNNNEKDQFVVIHFKGYKSSNTKEPYINYYDNIIFATFEIMKIYNELYVNNRYELLIESEQRKITDTINTISGFYSKEPYIFDSLMKLNEFRGKLADKDDLDMVKIQDSFQFYSFEFPYQLRSIIKLMEIGNYSDACILVRSMIETFFYYKYFVQKHDGDGLYHYINQDQKHGIKIKDIMEKIAPGYYDRYYAELCKFTHGNPLATGLFRGNVSKQEPLKYNMYNINLDWISYILNYTMPMILGYISLYKIVYKKNTINKFKLLDLELQGVVEFIENDMSDRYNTFEKQRDMIDIQRKIIGI